jgi:hypothetical protein
MAAKTVVPKNIPAGRYARARNQMKMDACVHHRSAFVSYRDREKNDHAIPEFWLAWLGSDK